MLSTITYEWRVPVLVELVADAIVVDHTLAGAAVD